MMMQQLCAYTERANAAAARILDDVATPFGYVTAGTTTFAWNAKPSVHASAICTHGKRYERRLREMLT